MRGVVCVVDGLTTAPLVRLGEDYYHPERGHTFDEVHAEMLVQICLDYSTLPDPRALRASEIRFFYDGIRPALKAHTKPKG